jgi:Zn-dependent M28 family amino/carboxypeptidase
MAVRHILLPLLLAGASPAAAAVTAEQLARHVDILASDSFEGRAPGTEGERKTIDYIVGQWQRAGLRPAGEEGGWLQTVPLVTRSPLTQHAAWRVKRRTIEQDQSKLVLLGAGPIEGTQAAPVWFAGDGTRLGKANLAGATVLVLRDVPGAPDFEDRARAIAARGAVAVIGIVGPDRAWRGVQRGFERENAVDRPGLPALRGAMAHEAARDLLAAAGQDLAALAEASAAPGFKPRRLKIVAQLDARTEVRRLASHNVLGRLPGTAGTGESVLYLGHWDHLGICRAEGEADRICNGAVDNASGIAALIEIARGLAAGPRRPRDIVFLATTAEEMGLLGAEAFAERPTVPLGSIVAAINLDTVAIAPKGERVAVMGRGRPALDRIVDQTIAEAGRTPDPDDEAEALVQRQDGWALARFGVPTLMVGGSFSDMRKLGAFLEGDYHGPGDNPGPGLVLDGAAEDADLLIALGRKLADPTLYRHVPLAGTAAAPSL